MVTMTVVAEKFFAILFVLSRWPRGDGGWARPVAKHASRAPSAKHRDSRTVSIVITKRRSVKTHENA